MKIIDEEGYYWTENKDFGFWGKDELFKQDKRDFFIIKALSLLILMRLCGIKAKFVKEGQDEQ